VTWELAASGGLMHRAALAGQHVLAASGYTARDLGATLAILLACAAVYLGSCLIWEYAPCLACRGRRGRSPGSNRRRHGRCKVCKGTGERLRVGTRILLAVTDGRLPKGVRK
jgi:hypothetical protein